MDFQSLLLKLGKIDSKQILNESKIEKKQIPNEYTTPPVQSTSKINLNENLNMNSSIARALMQEFGIQEEAGEFKFSPEQEKWLGGSDRQDPYILARMPGPKPPASFFTNPESQEIIKQGNFSRIFKGPVGAPGTAKPPSPVQGTTNAVSGFPTPDTTSGSGGGAGTKPAAIAAQLPNAGLPKVTQPVDPSQADADDLALGKAMRTNAGLNDIDMQIGQGQQRGPAPQNAGFDEFGGLGAAMAAQSAQQADTTSPDTSGTGGGQTGPITNWVKRTDLGPEYIPGVTPAPGPAKGGINPTVLNRYKELLDKLEGAGKTPAKPAASKPATGAGTKPAPAKPNDPAAITGDPNQKVGGGTINSLGAAPQQESVVSKDDRLLATLKALAVR